MRALQLTCLLACKVDKDPDIACFTLLRHNVQRDCKDPATVAATPETVTLEQMVRGSLNFTAL